MANEEKPQQDKVAKPAVKKATRKKAPAKKRATAKKTATKKAVSGKPVAKKIAAKAASTEDMDKGNEEVVVAVPLEKPSTPPQPPSQPTTATRQVWWRAAIMVAVVVLIFTAIRNATHDELSITDKSVAPSPWASQESGMETGQPHPWELAPAPQADNFNEPPLYYTPPTQQPAPRSEPWQATQRDTPLQTKPFYPPPPGPYGFAPSTDNSTPYPR